VSCRPEGTYTVTDVEPVPATTGGAKAATTTAAEPPAPAGDDASPGIPRTVPAVWRIVKRVPFTTAYVVITMVLSVVLGTLWSAVEDKSWFVDVGYGLPAFSDGRWSTIVFGNFFALYPVYYLFVAGMFALLTGFAEWRLGTARTVVLTIVFQLFAVLGTALIFWIFKDSGWAWAAQRGTETDVGFSAGMLGVLCVATATVRPPWRLRLRLGILVYVGFSILYVGQMADGEHLLAVLASLPFATALAGPRGLRARALPTRHEIRLLAFIGVLVFAIANLLPVFLPDANTPFGSNGEADDVWWVTVITLVIQLLIANGLRQGRRWAWWIELVLLSLSILLAVLVVAAIIYAAYDPDVDISLNDVGSFLANAVLSLAFFVLLIVNRRTFRVPRRSKRRLALSTSQPEIAKELLRKWGGDTISWMTTWPDNRHMVTADGESYLAFVRHAGVAVALGDPVGPPGSNVTTLQDFVSLCDRAGLVPYLFSCTEPTVEATAALGWKSAQVAEDNLIDLPQLEFKGKKWQDIRTALNKAPKEGVEFRMVTLTEEPWRVVQQVEHLSAEWLGDKKLPEMGFTLGGLEEALDPEVKVGLAVGADGKVHGVTSWMPVYGGDGTIAGWTLDLMRRADGGFRATMEFLIASSCLYFKEQGAQFVSLSGAPLARSADAETGTTAVDRLLDGLGASLEPVYGFRSLHAFKSKFQPRLSPLYMVFRDEADLPRIGIAITKAYLPDASLGEMLSVVRH
jgi:lysylphosphatidylglycerol synthetase-like protein (DUF2156 family)